MTPELTEFECGMLRYLQDGANCKDDAEIIKETKKHSENLLRYACKQFDKETREKEAAKTKRLPTIEEWRWLIDNCEWKWDHERKGQVITAKNGNSIFLPAAGYRDGTSFGCAGSDGGYWSSSLYGGRLYGAYYVGFSSGNVGLYRYYLYGERSVRPVSDTPMEGFVDMGNGLYWAEKNEEGYFTYDEAMKLFNDSESKEITEHEMSMLLAVIREPVNAASESCHLALQSIYGKLTMK